MNLSASCFSENVPRGLMFLSFSETELQLRISRGMQNVNVPHDSPIQSLPIFFLHGALFCLTTLARTLKTLLIFSFSPARPALHSYYPTHIILCPPRSLSQYLSSARFQTQFQFFFVSFKFLHFVVFSYESLVMQFPSHSFVSLLI